MRIALRGRGTDYERGGQGDYCCIILLTSPLSESHGVGGQVKNPPERIPITTSETGRTSRGNRTTHRDDDGGSDAVDKNRVIVVRGRASGLEKDGDILRSLCRRPRGKTGIIVAPDEEGGRGGEDHRPS